MKCEVVWDKYLIKYSVSYKARKSLGISVMPDKSVCVQAPIDSAKEEIEKRIIKRAKWIVNQWRYFDSFGEATAERRYISGESHYYLGRQYMLKVEEGKPNSVKYKGRYFEVVCTPKSKAKELMKGWYRERAKVKFAEIAEPIIARYARYGVEPSSIYIQEMASRWGSCTQSGKVILNTELVKMPKPCIEYVITHELTHLVHRNHTKAFYDLLESEMSDWKRWKDKLERFL